MKRRLVVSIMSVVFGAVMAAAQVTLPATPQAPEIVLGKKQLASKDFLAAQQTFTAYLAVHPRTLEGELGLADAELGLHAYEAAELRYRAIVATEPTVWAAHKNLVIVEAALGRWEEFDRERALLRAAKERSAPGISRRESDVIEVFQITTKGGPQRWIVRDFFEPEGRAGAVLNFERFAADGRVKQVVSLESAKAFSAIGAGDVVAIGPAGAAVKSEGWALDWYNGTAHGRIATYATEPAYETARRDVIRWARTLR